MTFDERFRLVYPRIQAIAKKYSYAYPVPYEEYESMMCEEFIKIDASFDAKVNDSYSSYVGSKLDQVALRMSGADRKERRFHDSIEPFDLPEGDEEERKYPVELIADVDIEEQVFDEMFVEEQLSKASGITREILVEFFADPYASYFEIAKRLGVSNHLVKRHLEKVALAVRGA
jgi:hypothetical protein